jgi:subfamily B ATP-binding cassette protein MsbA
MPSLPFTFMPDPAPISIPGASAAAKQKTKLSLKEALMDGNAGYKKLWPYVAKYKTRFFLSIAAGGGSAILTAGQAQVIRLVTHQAFREGATAAAAKTAVIGHGYFMDINFHEWADTWAVKPVPILSHVLLVASLLPLVIITRSMCDYLENYYMTWVSLKVLHDLRIKLFHHILSQSLDFFNKSKIGSLISRVSNDTRSAQLAITAVTDDIVTQPLTVVAVVCNMLYTDWRFTLYSLAFLPLCMLPIIIFGARVRKIGRVDETSNAELMVILHEALAGIRLVKSLCREPFEQERFVEASNFMVAVSLMVRNAMGIVGPLIEGVAALGIMMALVYVYYAHMQFSVFITLLGSLFLLYAPIKKLSKVHVSIQKALGATTKIFELLEVVPTIQDKPDGGITLEHCRGGITFDDVTFRYNVKNPLALRGVTVKIEPGKSYALVGASGAGKSTMFSMLLRFYDPMSGSISIDGHDLRSLTQHSIRQNIGMVSQDTFLFHESIMDNIRYGRLDATDEEIYEAARQAFAHDFILAQPQGYQTMIGDKGCLISGGQQQRLAIARALLKNAPILLLDEATSALDSESEHEIQAALERLATGRTVIAIAHRLSTILKADQIVVMDQGQIKEVGRHEELLENSVLYRRLYDLQFNQGNSAQ